MKTKDYILLVAFVLVISVIGFFVCVHCVFRQGGVSSIAQKEITADLSEENIELIYLPIELKKSLYEANNGIVEAQEQPFTEELREIEWIDFICTAYCGCELCVGKWHTDGYTLTASGWNAEENWTIAADEMYPFGTVIYIEGLGERMVMDRGSAIHGNHIDLYYENHEQACEWGMQTRRAYIVGVPE